MSQRLCKLNRRDIRHSGEQIYQCVREPVFFCQSCARCSNHRRHLCKPASLPVPVPSASTEKKNRVESLDHFSGLIAGKKIKKSKKDKKREKKALKQLKKINKKHKKLLKRAAKIQSLLSNKKVDLSKSEHLQRLKFH